nr:MAG TPA: hypothetical protein [Caudoviricetes sp.]
MIPKSVVIKTQKSHICYCLFFLCMLCLNRK